MEEYHLFVGITLLRRSKFLELANNLIMEDHNSMSHMKLKLHSWSKLVKSDTSQFLCGKYLWLSWLATKLYLITVVSH